VANPTAIGVLTLEQFQQAQDKLTAIPIDGVEPTSANIASSTYPLSRGLYIYAIKHRVSGSRSFRAFVRDNMGAKYRYDADPSGWGFLRLDDDERAAILANIDH
jgi:ABC-type phosphate transport system substrate-binding protein